MKRVLALALVALMLAVIVPVYARETEVPAAGETRALPVGMDISDVNAPYITAGGQASTTDFLTAADFAANTVIVINAWDAMCGPCTSEMPAFQQIHEEYQDRGVLVVGVCTTWIGATYAQDYNYLQSMGYTYINVKLESVFTQAFSYYNFLPQTIIVNSEGIVIDIIAGSTNYNSLKSKVEQWLGYYSDTYYDVDFVCGVTGEVFLTQSVHAGYQPTYPSSSEVPQVEGYSFSGWNPSTPPYISGPTTITANYIPRNFFVKFYDSIDGTLIKTKTVPYGSPVEPPTPPVHPGYVFVGWDHDLSCITENLNVYTIYSASGGAGGDVDGDGEVTAADALIALRASMDMQELTPEQIEQADVDGDGDITAADALLILRMSMGIN